MEASNLPCEDFLLIEPILGPGQGGLYAVIDGHGGVTSAEHITRLLPVEYRKLLDAGVPPGKALVDALAEVEKIIISMSRKDREVRGLATSATAAVRLYEIPKIPSC
jgi:serine/threonine protein phosphatase PrpC